jgi:hypothetical protein
MATGTLGSPNGKCRDGTLDLVRLGGRRPGSIPPRTTVLQSVMAPNWPIAGFGWDPEGPLRASHAVRFL